MQNIYMTPLRYKNFNGQEKSTKLHFHLTPREFADWMIENKELADNLVEALSSVQEQAASNPDGEASEIQKLTMLRLVKILAELSYGKPSEDGEYFDKKDLGKFAHSAAYDAFRMFLFENPKELEAFVKTILSEEVINEYTTRITGILTDENGQPAQLQSVALEKDLTEMSREELVEMMRQKTQQ